MDFSGKIYKIGEIQSKGQSGFQVREFILEEYNPQSQYANYIPFQLSGNNINRIDEFKAGDMVTVTCDVRGRLWTNPQGEERCLMNLNAWRIVQMQQGAPMPMQQGVFQQPPVMPQTQMPFQPMQAAPAAMPQQPQAAPQGGNESELPF